MMALYRYLEGITHAYRFEFYSSSYSSNKLGIILIAQPIC